MKFPRWTHALGLAGVASLASCEHSVTPPPLGDMSLSVVSGDHQSGSAGQELPNPLVVKVTKPNGGPVTNQVLNFRVVSGGGSVFAGTALTNAKGIAQERWTLGGEGEQKVEVRAVDNTTGAPLVFATFTATAVCDCWTATASLNFARYTPVSAIIGGKIYVTGYVNSVEVYDAISDRWNVVGDAMPYGVSGGTGAALNGQLYVVAGHRSDGGLGGLQSFEPLTGLWTSHADPPTARLGAAAAALGGILYLAGGDNDGTFYDTFEAYDPSTNTWTAKSPLPAPRRQLGLVALNGLLYAIGGQGPGGLHSEVWAYNPSTNSWTPKASMPGVRMGAATGVVNGSIYVAGGYGAGFQNDGTVLAYDAVSDRWSTHASMRTARVNTSGSVLDGQLYVIGGYDGQQYVGTVEAYRP